MSYKRFDPEDLVLSAESITQAAWETGTPTLTTFYTSSTQVGMLASGIIFTYLDLRMTVEKNGQT